MDSYLRGEREKLPEIYLHTFQYTNERMEEGLIFDSYVKEYVRDHKALPPELGNHSLLDPVAGLFLEVPYQDKFLIKGEMDIYDAGDIIEVKHSRARDSVEWSDSIQLDFYFLLHELKYNSQANRAILYRYDPTYRKYDRSIVYPSNRRRDNLLNLIATTGEEMYTFMSEQGVV
jgi:hypothetical protein